MSEGIIGAAKEVNLAVPLEGTNCRAGQAILAISGILLVGADSLGDAAAKIVAAVRKAA